MQPKILVPSMCLALACAPACGDDETTTGTGTCVDYTAVDINACNGGPCSFAADIIPIFHGACSLSTACHLTGNNSGEDLGLGPGPMMMPTPMEIDAVYAAIVNRTSNRSDLPLVTPGEPAESWLLAKVEYEDLQSCPTNACATTADGCGVRMPQAPSQPPLEAERVAKLRAWIKAGAAND